MCLGVARDRGWFVGVLVGQGLVALRSFTEAKPSHATVCVGGTFQPPRYESGLAAFEAAVDVLSDAQVHPSGKSVVFHM